MSPNQNARSFIDRVKSARLARILLVYLAVSWGVIQALDILSQQFALPDWFFPAGIGLLAIGFPILVATAFIQARLARADASAVGVGASAASVASSPSAVGAGAELAGGSTASCRAGASRSGSGSVAAVVSPS